MPLVAKFSRRFGLVGGTAIALHIGHRESIDFDLFTLKDKAFVNSALRRRILENRNIDRTIVNKLDEFTFVANSVKFTFYHYPYEQVEFNQKLDDIIKMPDLLTLGAMKAHALGQRAKWKDYVDLYFIIKDFYTVDEIIKKTVELFGSHFNPKMFKVQLSYFDDVNYDEEVRYKKGFKVDKKTVKDALTKFSLE